MRRRFIDLLTAHPSWLFELYAAMHEILWGCLFLVGGIRGDRPPFTVFGQVMPREYIWGLFFLFIGSMHLRALFIRQGREFYAKFSAYLWTWVAIAIGLRGAYAGFAIYSLLALFCVLASLRVRLLKRAGVIND